MKIQFKSDGTTQFELSEKENAAIDEAMLIVENRAKEENGDYNKQALVWWLCGILRDKGIEGMLKAAKETPFRRN